jgi:hypothetical protein
VDRRPSAALLRVANPFMRVLLSSSLGRLARQTAVLRFAGRRTGRTYRIVVGLHVSDGVPVVFTPARWRLNFRGGAPVTVRHRGRTLTGTGTLIEDPEAVAAAFQRVIDGGVAPRLLGLGVESGHRLTAQDMRAIGRAMVRVELDDPLPVPRRLFGFPLF